jgi:hypothetical protein
MNTSIKVKENACYDKKKPFNHPRKERLPPLFPKKNDGSFNDLSVEIAHLSKSINNMRHEPHVTFDEILKSSNSNLGKLYRLFFSLKDNKDDLLNEKVFDDFIRKTTEGLLIPTNQLNKNSMTFFEFINQIQLLAKENHLNKEYLYEKVTRPQSNFSLMICFLSFYVKHRSLIIKIKTIMLLILF